MPCPANGNTLIFFYFNMLEDHHQLGDHPRTGTYGKNSTHPPIFGRSVQNPPITIFTLFNFNDMRNILLSSVAELGKLCEILRKGLHSPGSLPPVKVFIRSMIPMLRQTEP